MEWTPVMHKTTTQIQRLPLSVLIQVYNPSCPLRCAHCGPYPTQQKIPELKFICSLVPQWWQETASLLTYRTVRTLSVHKSSPLFSSCTVPCDTNIVSLMEARFVACFVPQLCHFGYKFLPNDYNGNVSFQLAFGDRMDTLSSLQLHSPILCKQLSCAIWTL